MDADRPGLSSFDERFVMAVQMYGDGLVWSTSETWPTEALPDRYLGPNVIAANLRVSFFTAIWL